MKKKTIFSEERVNQFLDECGQEYLEMYNSQTEIFLSLDNAARAATWKGNTELANIIKLLNQRIRKAIHEKELFRIKTSGV